MVSENDHSHMEITYKKIIFAALIFGVAFHAGDDIIYQKKACISFGNQLTSKIPTSGDGWVISHSHTMIENASRNGPLTVSVFKRMRFYQLVDKYRSWRFKDNVNYLQLEKDYEDLLMEEMDK